jgi:hypothetical protein
MEPQLPVHFHEEQSRLRSRFFALVRTAAENLNARPPPPHLLAAAQDAAAQDAIDEDIQHELRTIAQARERIRQLNTKRNACVSFAHLPNELVTLIFLLVRDSSAGWSWTTVLGVSTAWRSIALNFAPLWTRITGFSSPPWTKIALARARSAPLDLHVALLFSSSWEGQPAEVHENSAPVLASAGRARYMTLVLPHYLPSSHKTWAAGFLATNAPVLEALAVDNIITKGYDSTLLLPSALCVGDHAPALVNLRLRNCIMPVFPWSQFSTSIVSLNLSFDHHLPAHVRHSTLHFQHIVRCLPKLEDLTLAFAMALLPNEIEIHIPELR